MRDEKKNHNLFIKKSWHFFQKFQNIATDYSPSFFFHFHKISHPKTKSLDPFLPLNLNGLNQFYTLYQLNTIFHWKDCVQAILPVLVDMLYYLDSHITIKHDSWFRRRWWILGFRVLGFFEMPWDGSKVGVCVCVLIGNNFSALTIELSTHNRL